MGLQVKPSRGMSLHTKNKAEHRKVRPRVLGVFSIESIWTLEVSLAQI